MSQHKAMNEGGMGDWTNTQLEQLADNAALLANAISVDVVKDLDPYGRGGALYAVVYRIFVLIVLNHLLSRQPDLFNDMWLSVFGIRLKEYKLESACKLVPTSPLILPLTRKMMSDDEVDTTMSLVSRCRDVMLGDPSGIKNVMHMLLIQSNVDQNTRRIICDAAIKFEKSVSYQELIQ